MVYTNIMTKKYLIPNKYYVFQKYLVSKKYVGPQKILGLQKLFAMMSPKTSVGTYSLLFCACLPAPHIPQTKCCPVTWPPVQSTQCPAQCSVGARSRRRTDVAVMTARWSALGVL